LGRALQDEMHQVAQEALEALRNFRQPEIIAWFVIALESKNGFIHDKAHSFLN
jgi:hypothetical protein